LAASFSVAPPSLRPLPGNLLPVLLRFLAACFLRGMTAVFEIDDLMSTKARKKEVSFLSRWVLTDIKPVIGFV
jgi:hypothetical protein